MKILFTSIGRRVELVQTFIAAAEKNNLDLIIYGADMTETAPALSFCDRTIIVPRIISDDYIPVLLQTCKNEKIDAFIPTIDTDLLILAQNKEKFLNWGTRVLISNPDQITICRDKRLTADFFRSIKLNTPQTVDDYQLYNGDFPAFIKPKDGSSSIMANKVNDIVELKNYAEEISNYIVQPFIEGIEYTIDAFCDFDGNPIYITPRIRLAVRAGEVLKTQIDQCEVIIDEMKRLINVFRPCGPITVQLIRQKDTNEDFFIEINPRYGGGTPLSIKAGADSAEALLKLLLGSFLSYQEKAAEDGSIYSRFDQSIRVK